MGTPGITFMTKLSLVQQEKHREKTAVLCRCPHATMEAAMPQLVKHAAPVALSRGQVSLPWAPPLWRVRAALWHRALPWWSVLGTSCPGRPDPRLHLLSSVCGPRLPSPGCSLETSPHMGCGTVSTQLSPIFQASLSFIVLCLVSWKIIVSCICLVWGFFGGGEGVADG